MLILQVQSDHVFLLVFRYAMTGNKLLLFYSNVSRFARLRYEQTDRGPLEVHDRL